MRKGEKRIMRRRLAGAWISSVISISLVLLLVGVGSLLLVNASSVSDYFKENMQVSVILKQEVSEADAGLLANKLKEKEYIKEIVLISRETGIKEMAQLLGEDFLEVFETAPVPVSLDVSLKADYVSSDSLAVVQKDITASPLVDEVVYRQSLVDALNANLRKISLVLAIFIALLLFISFVLINNTVRLNVFARRFTIHTMKLVGASRSFIRRPFLLQGAIQGLFSALIAILMLIGGLFILRNSFSALFEVFSLKMLLVVMGIVVASGVLICVISTYFVVNRLLSLSKDQLYA